MMYGNTKKAVKVLEDVKDFLSFQSELGGEALLEYGMVLETVDRAEEARKIYGQLVTVNVSPKVKRSALQLLQGLEITMKLRKKGSLSNKPVMDYESLQTMSSILSTALTDEWADYKKKESTSLTWIEGKSEEELYKLETNIDVYNLLVRAAVPLKSEKIPSDVIRRAFRKLYLLSDDVKLQLISQRLPALLEPFKPKKRKNIVPDYYTVLQKPSEIQRTPSTSKTMAEMFDSVPTTDGSDITASTSQKNVAPTMANVFEKQLNGSWELVLSLADTAPAKVIEYEMKLG